MGGNNPIAFLSQLMSNGNNPQQIIENYIRQNPQVNAILNQQKQSGMSMEQYVRQYASQNNIDINPMIKTLQQRGFKF